MAINEVKAILTAEDRNYTSTMQKAQGVTEGFGKKLKSGIGFGAFMAIGQKAMNVVGNAIATNVSGAVKRLDTLNQFPKVMQSLGFSADEAGAGITKLADNIDHLPTTLDAVASQAQQFVPLTGSIEKATDVTLALNNAIAAGGAPAEQQASAINQWTQAMAKGKPDLMDWRSMVQAAPAQMDQLAKSMLGASANQQDLYAALQNGSVGMDEVNDKMIELTNASEGFDIAGRHYDNFAEQAKNASGGINMALVNTKAAIQRNLANIFDAFDQKVSIGGTIQSIIQPMNNLGKMIQNIFKYDSLAQGLSHFINQIGIKAKELIPKGLEMIQNLLTGIGQGLPQVIQSAYNMVGNIMIGIAKGLPQLILGGINAITGFVNGIASGESALKGKGLTIMLTLVKSLLSMLPQLVAAAGRLALAFVNLFVQRMMTLPNRVMAVARKVAPAIKRGIGNLASIGRDLIAGLWNGIKAKFDGVISRVSALAAKLPKAVKKVLGIGSPSKVMKQLGKWTGEGFAIGIEKSYRQVQNAMGGIYNLQPAGMGGMLNTAFSDAYDYNVSARYEVVVPVNLNGREIARASANDMRTALNQIETRANRKVGIR